MDKTELRLRLEIETLRERVRQLEAELVPQGIRIPREYRLTPSEATILRRLMVAEIATPQSIVIALYGSRADYPDQSIINVWICKLRKKLNPFGVKIINEWGQGYRLESRELPIERAA